jgi:hypothetical protein
LERWRSSGIQPLLAASIDKPSLLVNPMKIKFWLPVLLILTTSALHGQYYVNGGWGGGASTVGGSYAHGYADVVRSQGEAQLNDSIAAGNYADARSKEIDNRLKAEQTYFQMRDINKRWTEANKLPPLTQEEAYRWAKELAPTRPNTSQLDPVTGKVMWPILLRDTPYQESCDQLDKLFAARATQGTFNYDQYAQVQQAHDDIVAAMTKNAARYKSSDIATAKNFIDGLNYEARFPAG